MVDSDFLRQLDDLFEFDAGTITAESELQQLPGWGSLTFLGLLAMVDEDYGVALKPQQVLACVTVADLMALMKAASPSG
jgi:acyl carrier protein